MSVTRASIIKWIRMTEIQDCSKNACQCADILRRLLVTRPINEIHEKDLNNDINIHELKYYKCIDEKKKI